MNNQEIEPTAFNAIGLNPHDNEYHGLLTYILEHGKEKADRTGVGTISSFGHQLKFDLNKGFPLMTTKKVWFRGIEEELLWMLKGSTNNRELKAKGVNIWTAWEDRDGDLGKIYGYQWRKWLGSLDQMKELVWDLQNNPNSRRLIVTAWNPNDLKSQALPPCHCFFQCYVNNGVLSLQVYQRSADMFLGLPFDIASYALLMHILAAICNLKVGELTHTIGDAHIYLNHLDQVKEQLTRTSFIPPEVSVILFKKYDIETTLNLGLFNIQLFGYVYHPAIRGVVAV
jgi:thymidylate synthase